MNISVIVLTCNRAPMLRDCLEALAAQKQPVHEIVVADTGSTDETPEVLDAFGRKVAESGAIRMRILKTEASRGWAGVRNEAARQASGDWIAFTDDDCEPAPDWSERIAANAARGLDAVGGLVLPAPDLRFPWWWHPDMAWAAGLSVPGHRGPDAGRVYYPQTANWTMRREVLLQEPFQEIDDAALVQDSDPKATRRNLYAGGREDAELWRRLRLHGWRTGFDASMRVVHRIPRERLFLKAILRRAFLDGVAAQRREARPEMVEWAISDLLGLPGALAFHIWTSPHGPLREALWRLTWAVRQTGQVCAHLKSGGKRGYLKVAGICLRNALRRTSGWGKRQARALGGMAVRLTRARKAPPVQPRSIMVAAAGFVGDMTLLHPFFVTLKANHPEAMITLVTNRTGEELYAREPSLSALVVLGKEDDASEGAVERILRHRMTEHRPDILLVPYFYGVSPKPLFERRETFVVTFREEVGFSRRWWYERADLQVAKPVGHSESENLYHLFRHAGLDKHLVRTPLAFEPDEVIEATHELREQGVGKHNLVVVAPGSAKTEKLWREDRWAAIVRYLMEDYDLRVALMGAPGEKELCLRIADDSGTNPLVWCDAGLRKQALRLSSARLLVSVDNGLRYIAAEMETPTLALFGPTDERQWRPLAEPFKHGVVRACPWDLAVEERIGLHERYQMDRITTEQVRSALDEMLRVDL